MTPAQQLEARLKQQAAAAAEQQRLIELRQNAPYGEVVQCAFRDTQAKFGNEWHPTQPFSFAIHRSEINRPITLVRQGSSRSVELHLSFDGLNVNVCPAYGRSCATLAGTERAYSRGYSQPIVVNEKLTGKLYCSYPLYKNSITKH
ncbi:MAG TPA: hypothetical protein VKY35_01160 [Aliidiomarina sp.]|nr:hypothetical protein [Aliidiomarina sp.]